MEQIGKLANVLESLHYGLNDLADWDDTEQKRRNFWKHDKYPIRTISELKARFIEGLERLVSEYLFTSDRNEKLDRIFVDLLIAQEMYAFGVRWRALNGDTLVSGI